MRLAKTVACGVAALGLAAGGASAADGNSGIDEILLEPVQVTQVYAVDEDGDGVTDSYLFLEESDTLG
jgi:hypothetical protein